MPIYFNADVMGYKVVSIEDTCNNDSDWENVKCITESGEALRLSFWEIPFKSFTLDYMMNLV
jgi:hypothetical protein